MVFHKMYKWQQWHPPELICKIILQVVEYICRLMQLTFLFIFLRVVLVFGRVRTRELLLSLSLSRSCPADCDWKGFNWALSVYSPNHPDGACRGVLQDGRQIGQDLQTNTFTSFALQPQYVSPSGWSSLRIEWGQRRGRWPVIGGRSHCLLMEWERHSWLEWGLRSLAPFLKWKVDAEVCWESRKWRGGPEKALLWHGGASWGEERQHFGLSSFKRSASTSNICDNQYQGITPKCFRLAL